MRCSLLRWWLGTGIVASLLTCGCQHCQQCCPNCCEPTAPAGFRPADGTPSAGNKLPVVHTVAKPALPVAGAAPQHGPTAPPRFAHDPKYQQLLGIIAYSKIQDAWVLRYASVEDSDRYGGSVTLVYSGRLNAFKSGQRVRVEGHLIDPESRQIRPAFEAKSIRPAGP